MKSNCIFKSLCRFIPLCLIVIFLSVYTASAATGGILNPGFGDDVTVYPGLAGCIADANSNFQGCMKNAQSRQDNANKTNNNCRNDARKNYAAALRECKKLYPNNRVREDQCLNSALDNYSADNIACQSTFINELLAVEQDRSNCFSNFQDAVAVCIEDHTVD